MIMKIEMEAIGFVENDVKDKKDMSWGEDTSSIVLNEQYISGLMGLDDFSHVIIIYHLDRAKYEKDKHLQRRPQNRDDMPLVGIFSQRGKDRPNRIGMTSVEIVSVSDDRLVVRGLDAVDGTPVLDIKPYYPVYDKKDASVPDWVDRLMEHYF
jgi:tRNA-Thr(GGU) m(6)t(6)A37 methyltransferase TsaA